MDYHSSLSFRGCLNSEQPGKIEIVSLQRKGQACLLHTLLDLGSLSSECLSCHVTHCVHRSSSVSVRITSTGFGAKGNWCRHDDGHASSCAINNRSPLFLTQESHVFSQHVWNWQADLLLVWWPQTLHSYYRPVFTEHLLSNWTVFLVK